MSVSDYALLERLHELIGLHSLDDHRERLVELAEIAVRIDTVPAVEDELALGGSKLGGLPDLPVGQEWPRVDGRPMNFIGQITLSEVHDVAGATQLPASGRLRFWVDETGWGPESNPGTPGFARVDFDASEALELTRTPYPIAGVVAEFGSGLHAACGVEFHRTLSLPSEEEWTVFADGAPPENLLNYCEFRRQVCGGPARFEPHLMLGHPDCVNLGRREAEAERPGWTSTHWESYRQAAAAGGAMAREFDRASAKWTLLLQIASDDLPLMLWSDAGMFMFFVHEEDLAAGRLDRFHLGFECG